MDIGRERPSLTLGRLKTLRIPVDLATRARELAAEWEREDCVRALGPRRAPWLVLLLALMAACASTAPEPVLCTEIVDAHCLRVEECGGLYEDCVNELWSTEPYCESWRIEPECVEDIHRMECAAEMSLPRSCGAQTKEISTL